MRMKLLLVAAGTVAGLALLAVAPAEPARSPRAGTLPAATQPATATAPRPLWGPLRPPGATLEEVKALLAEPKLWARWACVLSGLSLAGILWVGYSLRTLARNQIELAKLIRAAQPPQE